MKNLILCFLFLFSGAKVGGAEQLFHQPSSGGAKDLFPSVPAEVPQMEKDQTVLDRIKILLLSAIVDKKFQLEKICHKEMECRSIEMQLTMATLVIPETPNISRHLFWRVGCNPESSIEQVIKAANGLLSLEIKDLALTLYKCILTQPTMTFRIFVDISRDLKTLDPHISTIACCQAALWLPLKDKSAIISFLLKNNYQASMPTSTEQIPDDATVEDLIMIADGARVIDEKLRIEILQLSAQTPQ